jgi:hypothetical protein
MNSTLPNYMNHPLDAGKKYLVDERLFFLSDVIFDSGNLYDRRIGLTFSCSVDCSLSALSALVMHKRGG